MPFPPISHYWVVSAWFSRSHPTASLHLLKPDEEGFSSSEGFSLGGGSGRHACLPLPLFCCLHFFVSLRATEPPFGASLCALLIGLSQVRFMSEHKRWVDLYDSADYGKGKDAYDDCHRCRRAS